MTRSTEQFLQRLLLGITLLLIGGAAFFLVEVACIPQKTVVAGAQNQQVQLAKTPAPTPKVDAEISRLLVAKMTRTVATRPPVVEQAPVPSLSTLIKVKGIMDFGDPKTNEAIIEIIRSSQTRNCKVGEVLQEVNATVTAIDTGVSFKYDSKIVRLSVNSSENAEAGPVAAPAVDALSASRLESKP